MNRLKHLFVSSAIMFFGASVFAGVVTLHEVDSPSALLPECGGTVSLSRGITGQLYLVITSDTFCSNITVNGRSSKITPMTNIPVSEGTTIVFLSSNSGKHFDQINIVPHHRLPKADVYLSSLAGKRFASIPHCGGTVELEVFATHVNLRFRDVAQCSNFDVLTHDGRPVNYANQKLSGTNGSRYGTFRLPQHILDLGVQGVKVMLRSNSSIHEDVIYVQFFAL